MKLFIIALCTLLSTTALAAEQTAATSEAQSSSFIPKEVFAEINTHYHGSSLRAADTTRLIDRTGAKLGKAHTTNFDSDVSGGYRLTDKVKMTAIVPFLAFPSPGPGNTFTLGDVGLKLSQTDTINFRNFHLNSSLTVQASTSESSRARHQTFAVKTSPSLRYDPGETDFSVGALNEVKSYVGVTTGKTLKVWALPYARYRLNKSVAFNLAYELELNHLAHNPAFLSHQQHDLQPSVIWNVTKSVVVQPYLQIFSLNSISTARTGFGTMVSAALL